MKAMELVAASKMRRATQLALGTRPYSKLIGELTERVRHLVDSTDHPLLVGHQARSKNQESRITLFLLVASDRGLCGGFNSQIVKKALEFLRRRPEDEVRVVTVGRRAEQAVKRAGYALYASFESIANAPSFERAHPIGDLLYKEFMAGSIDRVFVGYTEFKSALTQIPTVFQLLPLIPEEELSKNKELRIENSETTSSAALWEPSPDQVFDQLLPRALEMTVYQSFLESAASEQSARMLAMKSAGDAAGDMLDDLTFSLNQARQSSITREISEISAGKAAIE